MKGKNSMLSYENMSTDELKSVLISLGRQKENIVESEKAIRDALAKKYADQIPQFGTLNIDGIRFTNHKQIDWDQEKLAELYKEMGNDAPDYIDVKFNIPEQRFKYWPKSIKDKFLDARTVKNSTLSVKIIEE